MNFKEFLETSESFTKFLDWIFIESNCKGLTEEMLNLIMENADKECKFREFGLDKEVPGKLQVLVDGLVNNKHVIDLLRELHKMLAIREIHAAITAPIDTINDILYDGVELQTVESGDFSFSLLFDHDLSDQEYTSLSNEITSMGFDFKVFEREENLNDGMRDDEIWISAKNIELEYLLHDFEQKLGASKISLFLAVKLGGTCIRCGKGIELDVYKPFCKDDYSDWWRTRTRDKPKKETYCHKCGKEYGSSLNEPLCPGCKDKTGSYS